jgi:PIN domain nuclease of toxin-antitoxin system
MTAPVYVLDSHTLIWHLQDSGSLSSKARNLLESVDSGRTVAIVPSIVLVELVYLAEKNRIEAELLDAALSSFGNDGKNYRLASLDFGVTQALRRIPRAVVPDMPDRIIAATALKLGCPLLSVDSRISALDEIDVVW